MSKVWAFFFPTGLGLFHLGSGFCLVGVLFGGVGSFALCALVFILRFVKQIFCSSRSAVVVTTYIVYRWCSCCLIYERIASTCWDGRGEAVLEIEYRGYHGRGTFWRDQKVWGLLKRSKRSKFTWFSDLPFCEGGPRVVSCTEGQRLRNRVFCRRCCLLQSVTPLSCHHKFESCLRSLLIL